MADAKVVSPVTPSVVDTVAPPVIARVDPLNVRFPLSSNSPLVPASTTRPEVRSSTLAVFAASPPLASRSPVTVTPTSNVAASATVNPSSVVAPSTSNVPDTVSLPVTERTEPLNVRLPLSSSSPDVPANTTLPDVRSATAADVAETVPPD